MDIVWLFHASSSLTPSTTARKRVIFCCCLYALHRLFSLLLILGSLFRMNRALIVNGRANETSWACFNNVCLLFWRKLHFTYQMRVHSTATYSIHFLIYLFASFLFRTPSVIHPSNRKTYSKRAYVSPTQYNGKKWRITERTMNKYTRALCMKWTIKHLFFMCICVCAREYVNLVFVHAQFSFLFCLELCWFILAIEGWWNKCQQHFHSLATLIISPNKQIRSAKWGAWIKNANVYFHEMEHVNVVEKTTVECEYCLMYCRKSTSITE